MTRWTEEKALRELDAVKRMARMIGPVNADFAAEVVDLFEEFEDGETQEAKIVHDMDYFECLCQANEYEKREEGVKDLADFQNLVPKIQTAEVRHWTQQVVEERENYLLEDLP